MAQGIWILVWNVETIASMVSWDCYQMYHLQGRWLKPGSTIKAGSCLTKTTSASCAQLWLGEKQNLLHITERSPYPMQRV